MTARSYRLPQTADSSIAKITDLKERPWSSQSVTSRQNGYHGNDVNGTIVKNGRKTRPKTTRETQRTSVKLLIEDVRTNQTRLPRSSGNSTKPHLSSTRRGAHASPKVDEAEVIKKPEVEKNGHEKQSWALTEVKPKPHQPSGAPFVIITEAEESESEDEVHGSESEADESQSESGENSEPEADKSSTDITENHPELKAWLEELIIDSDEYDTDLEDDFPPEPEPVHDATGQGYYSEFCKEKGQIPVSFLMRHMGDGHLRMRHHYLGGNGTKPLAEALKCNTVCEEIDLSDNYVDGEGAEALADMLKENMFVVNLNVSYNFMRSRGAHAFAEMLETNTTLKTLSLQGNQMTDTDAKRLSEALRANMSLGCLDLSHNSFGELGGIYIGMGLGANIGLADIDLSWNGIRQKGAVSIAKALHKNTSLEILDLSWNGLATVGTTALAMALKVNKTLRVLDISNNRIGTEAAKKLALGLAKNNALETVLMGMNPIGPEGIEAILKAVSMNTSLKLLGLEGIPDIAVKPSLQKMIAELQESRDIMIMYSAGSAQQSKINRTILAVFGRFVTENADRMEDLFNQMDKDKSGNITLEEFKYGLKDFGLRLTNKQLDLLLDELDADRSGTIEFDELMSGAEMVEQERLKIERVAKEEQIYHDSQQNNSNGINRPSDKDSR